MYGTSTVTWFISLPCDQCAWARWTADLQGNQHQDSKEFSELQSVRGMWFTPTPHITTPTENLNPLKLFTLQRKKGIWILLQKNKRTLIIMNISLHLSSMSATLLLFKAFGRRWTHYFYIENRRCVHKAGLQQAEAILTLLHSCSLEPESS